MTVPRRACETKGKLKYCLWVASFSPRSSISKIAATSPYQTFSQSRIRHTSPQRWVFMIRVALCLLLPTSANDTWVIWRTGSSFSFKWADWRGFFCIFIFSYSVSLMKFSHRDEHMNQNKKTTPDLFTFLFLNALPLSGPYRFPLQIIGPEKRIDSETRNHWRWHTTWANKPTAWLEEAVSPPWGALQLFLKIMLDLCPPPSSPALMPSL